MAKNHKKIRSTCFVHEFSFTCIFNDINHGYRAAIMKKNSLWLLRFYMAVAAYYYHEKVRRTMRTAIVSYLFKYRFYYNINLPHVTVVVFINFNHVFVLF